VERSYRWALKLDAARGDTKGVTEELRTATLHTSWHQQIHPYDIGPGLVREAHRLCSVGGFANHLQFLVSAWEHPQAFSDNGVIIGDENSDAHGSLFAYSFNCSGRPHGFVIIA
jgi:hypothetical protein